MNSRLLPPLMLILGGAAILAARGEDPPANPGPASVRIVVVALDARIVSPFEQKPFLVVVATGVTPTGGYSDPRLVALPGRTLEFELVAVPPAARFEGEPDEAETVMHASVRLPMPDKLPAMVKVIQPERFLSRRVD